MAKRKAADPREARRARAAESERRARMFVYAHLAWLEGFPDPTAAAGSVRWWRLDGVAVTVDRPLLARARRALRTLLGEHAAVLSEAVGDVAIWSAAVEARLEALGEAVFRGRPVASQLPALAPAAARVARAIVAAEPALAPAVEAVATALLARPDTLAATLRWIEARAVALARLAAAMPGPRGVLAVLQLAGLAADEGAAAVEPVVALVCVDATAVPAAVAVGKELANRLKGGETMRPWAALPTSTAPAVAWLPRLVAADRATRRRALALLALIDLATPLATARQWWQRAAPRYARALELAQAAADRGPGADFITGCLEAVEDAVKTAPPHVDVVAALGTVERAAWRGAAAHFPPLRRLIAAVPVALGPLARLRFLDEIIDESPLHRDPNAAAWLWDALAAELETAPSADRLLAPWRAAIYGTGTGFSHPLRNVVKSRADARRAAALLAACARRGVLTYLIVDRAVAFVPVAVAPDVVAATLAAAEKVGSYLDTAQVRAAVGLGGEAVSELVAALETISTLCDDLPARASGEIAALVEHARASDAAWALRLLLAQKRGRFVVAAAAIAAVVPRAMWPALTGDGKRARWIAHYPPALRPSLVRLASADPAAEATARKILRRDLPHPDDVARELTALRSGRPTGATAAGRLRRLETGSSPPSAVRLARLAERLDRVAAQVAIERFTTAITALATARLAEACGLPAWPGWPLDRARVAVLAALAKLSPQPRELAARLLRRRAGPPPWDLRDDPRNAAFLDGLRRRGLDPAPWLDDTTRAVRAADGTVLGAGFTADPLEVFEMGEHFNTCLGAGGHNFFSVVTNAADINKRVLYFRRPDGVVAGRCLFALTDGGRVLTFQPYAHDAKHGIPALVRTLALELAARMKTEVVGSGTVSTLVADDWYDDGPTDLVERFPALASGAPFRAELPTIAPADVAARLAAALDHPLDDVTLPLVVALPELQRRPALLVALGEHLLATPAIPDSTMIHAARIAIAGGDHTLAERLVAGRARASAIRDSPRWLGDVLALVRPSLALALLRATRERGVHGWRDEPVERLAVAARAMETLRRPRQAAELYRLAIAHGWKNLADELRPRLAALDNLTRGG